MAGKNVLARVILVLTCISEEGRGKLLSAAACVHALEKVLPKRDVVLLHQAGPLLGGVVGDGVSVGVTGVREWASFTNGV